MQISPKLNISFEFYPPKTAEMEETLWRTLMRLRPLDPGFVSVTYGAGGTTRTNTHAIVKRIIDETTLRPAAHLTCVAASRTEIDDVARQYWQAGIRHIVALRGDLPSGGAYVPHPNGYARTDDLIAGLKKIADFEISVAAYPEKHPESISFAEDLDNLKRKIDQGASRAISQFFFKNEYYMRFLDKARSAGINIPIIPGILPVSNFHQTVHFAKMNGTEIPKTMAYHFEGLDDDPETRRLVAAHLAAQQVSDLQAQGITDFHFYTLNRPELSFALCHLLGVRPK